MARKLALMLLFIAAASITVAQADFSLDFYTFNEAYEYYYSSLIKDAGTSPPPEDSYLTGISPSGTHGLFSTDMAYGTVYLDAQEQLSVEGVFSIVYDENWSEEYNFAACDSLLALVLALEHRPDITTDEILTIGTCILDEFYIFLPDVESEHALCYTGKYNYELFDLDDGRIALLAWRYDGITDLYWAALGAISSHRAEIAIEKIGLEADPYQVVADSLAIRHSIADSMGMKSWLHTYKYDALNAAIDKVNEDIERILANENLSEQDLAVANALVTLAGDLRDEVATLTDR